jgi:predicted ATPase
MNSYQRLILHRIAEYFGLAHIVDKNKVAVIIFKKEGATMYVISETRPCPLSAGGLACPCF